MLMNWTCIAIKPKFKGFPQLKKIITTIKIMPKDTVGLKELFLSKLKVEEPVSTSIALKC